MTSKQARLSRRRFLQLSLTAAGGMALAACGGPAAGTLEGFVPVTSALGTLRLSVWGDVSDASIYNNVLAGWHRAQSRYTARPEQYTGDYYSKVLANFAGGVPADVIYFQGWMWEAYADSQVLQPLDDFIRHDHLQHRWPDIENFRWNTRWKGKTYMSPADGGPLVMYYNKDLFDKRGIPYPRDEWTWDDFKSLVPRLTFTDGGKQYYGWAQAGGWTGAYGRVVPFMRRNGHVEWDRVIEPRRAQWNHPDVISALQFTIYDALNKGWSPSASLISGGGISFATGRVALVLEGPWYLPNLYGPLATTKRGINYDVVVPPNGSTGGNYSYAHIHGHVVAKQSAHKEGAWDLIKYITGVAGQRAIAEGARMCATPQNVRDIWAPIASKTYNFRNTDVFVASQRDGTTPLIMGEGATINAYGGGPLDSMWSGMTGLQLTGKQAVAKYEPQLQGVLDQYWAARGK